MRVCARASQSVHGWDRREKKEERDTSALQISRDICSVLMVVRSGLKEFRSSCSSTFTFAVRVTSCIRTYARVCGYEDSGQSMVDILDEASKTRGLKSFLNPVRRLNSLSNIGWALLYFFFFFPLSFSDV